MVRGPGGTEPHMILQRVREGLSFDDAVAEVERICSFKCEKWWIDLNREPITKAAKPAVPDKPGKG